MSRYIHVKQDDGSTKVEHRLIWEAAYGLIPPGYDIHHKDGNGKNNALDNLAMMTHSDHLALHASLREQGIDVIDPNDPDVIRDREASKKWARTHRKEIREYAATHQDMILDCARRYREKYPDRVKATQKKYRDTHVEKIKVSQKVYCTEHAEERNAKNKEWRQNNPDKERERHKHYRDTHPEFVAAQNAKKREYAKEHASELAQQRKEHYANNRESILEKKRLRNIPLKPLLAAKARLKRAIVNSGGVFTEEDITKRKEEVNKECEKLGIPKIY